MNRNSGNVPKTKKFVSGPANRKSFQKLSESSSISSNRNSSDEDVITGGIYMKPQVVNLENDNVMKTLQGQVKELRHKLRILEESAESKDYTLSIVTREKDRAIGEIRRLERSNKLLKQQLIDERNHYLEEKEKFCDEMSRYKKRLQELKSGDGKKTQRRTLLSSKQSLLSQRWLLNKEKGDYTETSDGVDLKNSKSQPGMKHHKSGMNSFSCSELRKPGSLESFHLYEGDDVSLQIAALRTENAKLRSIISERDERNYELCLRFLRMKHFKNDIRTRFQDLENEYLQVIANLMDKIDEARQEFNFIIDHKFKRPLHSTNAMYLQLVQKNSRMAFENASLRLENQCLKRELGKYMNGVSSYERPDKIRPDSKQQIFRGDSRVRKIKKNVNFKEVRTIYAREAFKNSDTDSNYISKATPTALSNKGVLPEDSENVSKEQLTFQANTIPHEILEKIFQRVDTPSNQSLISNKTGQPNKNDTSNFLVEKLKTQHEKKDEEGIPKLEIIEHKSPTKLADSSSPGGSKESVRLPPSEKPSTGKPEEKLRSFRTRLKPQAVIPRSKDSGDYTLDSKIRKSPEEDEQMNQFRTKLLRDGCGLQEKFSDLRISSTVETQTTVKPSSENNRKKPEQQPKIEMPESDDEDIRRSRNLIPVLGSRSRSSNKLNLQDELLEATGCQTDNDEILWKGDLRLSTLAPKSEKTYKINSTTEKDTEFNVFEQIAENRIKVSEEQDLTHRKPEGSKRFSHRLISSSPEQLKNILTESQLGACYQMAPVVVGHARTEISQTFKYHNGNEIFLQLIIPKAEQEPQTFTDEDKETIEKKTSISGLSPPKPSKPTNIPYNLKIPVSNLPTSSSTIDIVESVAFNDKNNIMLKTLSAPGLLESSWLDPCTICEMRDGSTNT